MSKHTAKLALMLRTYDKRQALGEAIAQNIRTKRVEAGLTQKELAELTDKKQPDIARQERSTYARHTINGLNKLAVALGTEVSDLVSLGSVTNTSPSNPPPHPLKENNKLEET